MCKKICLLVALASVAVLVGCVPPAPPSETEWLEIYSNDGALVTGQTVSVASGQSVSFYIQGGGGIVPEFTTWQVEEGQTRGQFVGQSYSNTFVNMTGQPITYKVTVIGHNSIAVPKEFWIQVASVPAVPIAIVDDLVLITGINFWSSGNLNPDGSISVVPGDLIWFDLTMILKGGIPPYFVYLNRVLQPGLVFSWMAPQVTVTTTVNLHILVVDSAGNSVEKWLVVIVVVNPPQPPLPVCGNGVVETGEQCDLGTNNGVCPATCSATCRTNNCPPPPECSSDSDCDADQHCNNGVCVDDPVAPVEIEVLAPAMDSTAHKGESVTFTVKITGGKLPYAVNWFFFDGTAPSTTGTSTTISITVVFNRTTAGQFPIDQYVQVIDVDGRVSAMAVIRIRVID